MSLCVCPKCKKKNNYWHIYWSLNRSHFHKKIECEKCGKNMEIKIAKRSPIVSLLEGILWMLPALILIYLVVTQKMHFFTAICLVTLYHFIAFWGIISYMKYKK